MADWCWCACRGGPDRKRGELSSREVGEIWRRAPITTELFQVGWLFLLRPLYGCCRKGTVAGAEKEEVNRCHTRKVFNGGMRGNGEDQTGGREEERERATAYIQSLWPKSSSQHCVLVRLREHLLARNSWAHQCHGVQCHCCLHSSLVSPEGMSGSFGSRESIFSASILGISGRVPS